MTWGQAFSLPPPFEAARRSPPTQRGFGKIPHEVSPRVMQVSIEYVFYAPPAQDIGIRMEFRAPSHRVGLFCAVNSIP